MKILSLLIVFLMTSSLAFGQGAMTIVAVGDAETIKDELALIVAPQADSNLQKIVDIIKSDFAFYKKRFSIKINEKDAGKNQNKAFITFTETKEINLKLENTQKKEELKFQIVSGEERQAAHQTASAIYKFVTGQEPIFMKKIVFVSEIGSGPDASRELFVMDFDGFNGKRLTHHKGTVISPAFSYSGDKIIYSLIKGSKARDRNIDLYIYDLNSKKSELLSNLKGINSGAIFLPGDEEILLTLSYTGNAEIYKMSLRDKKRTQITDHSAPDVDPDLRPDGKMLTFLSGRPGKAMIYTMDPSAVEKDVKRIGFVGEFNATPRFSPDGKMIVFSSWLDTRFDIFRINSDGTGLYRLTKDFGSNEDPSFSPDGEFIIFTSQRVISQTKATQNVYIMDRDGEIIGSLTQNYGNCISPRWSK